MANNRQDPLFDLIKSLTKSEKRNFRLFVKRSGNKEGVKFIMLFDAMDTMKTYDDAAILKKVPAISKIQFSNQKANLYRQLLASLRLYHVHHNLDMQLRESLDNARVLYDKGFYKQALKILDKTKTNALESSQHTIALEALEFEKLIESHYITRSIDTQADSLARQVNELNGMITTTHRLSNMALRLYGWYLRKGYVSNEKDFCEVRNFFQQNMPKVEVQKLSFYEKLYYLQSHVWYYSIVQNFPACYRHATNWVNLFRENPEMIVRQPLLYVKGLHNQLSALFHLQYYSKFCEALTLLENISHDEQMITNLNTEILVFKFLYTGRINKYYMEGNFTEGLSIIPELLEKLERYRNKIDPHRTLLFYYKIASLYFGSGDFRKAIFYLNQIVNFKDVSLREDIHCFARILNLIAHYEAGEDLQLEYQIRTTYHFLGKMNDQHGVQNEIFKFLRKVDQISPDDLKSEFKALHQRLLQYRDHVYERRPFLYLDILSWLESKIENRPVQEVIREKFKMLK